MHSRIFQITKSPAGEKIRESDYHDHWFTNEIADYVMDDDDPRTSMEWLGDHSGLNVDADSKTIVVTSKQDYFRWAYEKFTEAVAALHGITLERFSRPDAPISRAVYDIKSQYEDRFGFYADDCGEYGGLIPFDEWVRDVAVEGQTYYIGGTVDYHW